MNQRLLKLKQLLKTQWLDGSLISSANNIAYLTGFSGFSETEREAFLLITQKNQYLLTDGRYFHAVNKQVKEFNICLINKDQQLYDLIEKIIYQEAINKLGIEDQNLTVSEFNKIKPLVKEIDCFSLSEIRSIKDKTEIQKIQKACELGDKTFEHILSRIKPGITEQELSLEMEIYMKKLGGKPSFESIVAFGENAALPHHQTSERKLKNHELILLDFGIKYENYCSDMTRTVFLVSPDPSQTKIYQTVLEAQQKAIKYINENLSTIFFKEETGEKQNTGVFVSEVDKISRNFILSCGYPDIPHSLGHGVGLEVHEKPRLSLSSKEILRPGMVFSIEPGIYLPDNSGVRIEDLFALEDKKLIQLTRSPKEIIKL